MSQIVIHGGTIYLSGQVADDTTADIRGQMAQVLLKLETRLAAVGSQKANILSANIWLATMADFEQMNQVWEAWIPADSAPARATVQAQLVTPAHRVEIAVIAAA